MKASLGDFKELIDYPFEENFVEVDTDLFMHYVDEGKSSRSTILLLHGEPSWSYLYRHMITPLVDAGHRVIAPDLIGFGKSDKYENQDAYSYQNHIKWTTNLINKLELKEITLFCQDWGGLIGLRIVADRPHLFKAVIASNTGLPTGQGVMPAVFTKWVSFAKHSPDFDIGLVIQNATSTTLSKETVEAYNMPFPTEESMAGARIFPSLVPIKEEMAEAANNKKAWKALMQFDKPFGTIFSDKDPITKGGEKLFQKLIPACKGQNHPIISGGHFIQEDAPQALVDYIISFYEKNFK